MVIFSILTWFIKHLITLVQDKHLQLVEGQRLRLLDQLQDAPRRPNNDVRTLLWILKNFYIVWHRNTAEEDLLAYLGEVLGESVTLVFDLVGKLAGVAEDQHGWVRRLLLELMQDGKDENGSLYTP